MSLSNLENQFGIRLHEAVARAKTKYRYNPTRFLQLLGEKGPRRAAKQLLEGTIPAEGFGTLFQHGGYEGLSLSIEAIVATESQWHPLFDATEIAEAHRRLVEVKYPLAGHPTTARVDTRAPEPVGAYPAARRVGNLLFLSGQGPRQRGSKDIPGVVLGLDGKVVSYDIEAQVRAVFQNVKYVLEEHGSSMERIVDVVCFLTNLEKDFAAYNRVYAELFPAGPNQPCRTTIGISALPQGGNAPIAFEAKVIATVG